MMNSKGVNLEQEILDRMALDMGIIRYDDEDINRFNCRTLYSGMACWIKTATMDEPVRIKNSNCEGISRRHVYDKCNKVLNSFLETYPEYNEWFYPSESGDNPIGLIRSRLMAHGDIVNIGFDTNLALQNVGTKGVCNCIEAIYGEILKQEAFYSGISMLKRCDDIYKSQKLETAEEWLIKYKKDAWWERGNIDIGELQFFDSSGRSRNNYSLWQDAKPNFTGDVLMARKGINKVNYEYYLIRKDGKYHRMDPIMTDMGENIRVMLALRGMANNKGSVLAVLKKGYILLKMGFKLPRKELGLLESYAWPVNSINDIYNWLVPGDIWVLIKQYIEALNICITEEKDG